MPPRQTHSVTIGGLTRLLPLCRVGSTEKIAVLNLLGDSELTQVAASGLAEKLKPLTPDILVTAEAKSVALIYQLALLLDLPWIVLRKSRRAYMGRCLSAETHSITTGKKQTLYLDEKDRALVQGSRVALIDDVISTGSTLSAMRRLIAKGGGEIAAVACVFTEGDVSDKEIISLGHLPLFR